MKVARWLLEHFPFLASLGLGILAGTHHRPELALLFFVMAALGEIAGSLSDLRRDVKALTTRTQPDNDTARKGEG